LIPFLAPVGLWESFSRTSTRKSLCHTRTAIQHEKKHHISVQTIGELCSWKELGIQTIILFAPQEAHLLHPSIFDGYWGEYRTDMLSEFIK
jgi:hypothetical protein